MDAQDFLVALDGFIRPFANWPIWALIALATSTLHMSFVGDLFDGKVSWKKLPQRLLWSVVFFGLAGFTIVTIDPTPTYSFLGVALTVLAGFNLGFHVLRSFIGYLNEGSSSSSSNSSSNDGVMVPILLGLVAFAVCYVGWPMLAGTLAESAFVEDAQSIVKNDDGTVEQVVVLKDMYEDTGANQLILDTSAGNFTLASTPEYRVILESFESLKADSSDGSEPAVTRDSLYTITWRADDNGGTAVIDIRPSF